MSATSQTDKLFMMDNAPQITSEARPLPLAYEKDPYIKTMAAPVSIDGRKNIAIVTLEGQKNKPTFFHNLNPIAYWVKRYNELKRGIPSKSRWYQGKERKTPRFAHPAYKSGAIPKGINSIANNGQKIKPKFNFRDFAILLQRPLNLGYNGEIIFNNLIRAAGNQGTLPGRQPLRITNDPGSIQGSEILSRSSIVNKPKKNKPFKIIDILEALNRPYLGSIMVNEIYKNRRDN